MNGLPANLLDSLNQAHARLKISGRELFDLSMINPDIPPAKLLMDKLLEASLKVFNHRYSVSRGINKLREAFEHKYRTSFSVDLKSENEICSTFGSKDALLQLCILIRNKFEGPVVALMGAPTYPAHLAAVKYSGLNPHFFEISSDESRMLSQIESALADNTPTLLLLNFPNNPTGERVTAGFYQTLADIAKRRGNLIIYNDFVYGEMSFSGGSPVSLLNGQSFKNLPLVESYSLSKSYCVPGWRIGAIAGNSEIIGGISKNKSRVDYGIFLPIQIAGAAALSSEQDLVGPMVQILRRRGTILVEGLLKMGWEVSLPSAGACLWAKPPQGLWESALAQQHGGGDAPKSYQVALYLLESIGLQLMPGALFGDKYDDCLRFALVLPEEKLRTILDRLSGLIGSGKVTKQLGTAVGI